ncbi:hypothetical protein FB451DRAFT_1174710 [Mycena latifolia]|nr:hypothetical protein FB451DRAFT_1174710 [Mycena latifolia]
MQPGSCRQLETAFFCSEDNIQAFKQGVEDVSILTITPEALKALVQLRYANVQDFFSDVPHPNWKPQKMVDPNGQLPLYFSCPSGTAQLQASRCNYKDGNRKNVESFAVTSSILEHSDFDEIALCPKFFDAAGTRSSADEVKLYQAAKKKGNMNSFDAPKTPGVAMQSTNMGDATDDPATTPAQYYYSALSDSKKLENAENFALLGFLAHADPGRFTVPAPPPSSALAPAPSANA